jgi:hypothetical protein
MNQLGKIHLGILNEIENEGARTVSELTAAIKLAAVPFCVRELRLGGLLNQGMRAGTAMLEFCLTDYGLACFRAAQKGLPMPNKDGSQPVVKPLTDKQITQREAQSAGMVKRHRRTREQIEKDNAEAAQAKKNKADAKKVKLNDVVEAAAAAGAKVEVDVRPKNAFGPNIQRLDSCDYIELDLGKFIDGRRNTATVPVALISSVIATLQEYL